MPRVLEVWRSNLGSAKSYTALQTGHQRFNIYVAWRYDAAIVTDNSLHASAEQSEYNERFKVL